jgi:hypothetical protein
MVVSLINAMLNIAPAKVTRLEAVAGPTRRIQRRWACFISILPLKQLVAQFLNDDVGSFAMTSLHTWVRPAVVASRLNAEDDPSSIVSMSDFCVLVSWRHWEGIHGRVK